MTRSTPLTLLLALWLAPALAGEAPPSTAAPGPAALQDAVRQDLAKTFPDIAVGRPTGMVAQGNRATVNVPVSLKLDGKRLEATWTLHLEREDTDQGPQWTVVRVDPAPSYLRALLHTHVATSLRKEMVDESIPGDKDRPTPLNAHVLGLAIRQAEEDAVQATATVTTTAAARRAEGTWEVAFALNEKGRWVVEDIEVPSPRFGVVNYTVLFLYLAAMLGIGWWTSRFIHDTRGFFIAEGRLNHVVVGISILTAYLSALTMMGFPGMAFRKLDWLFAIQLPFLIFTAFVITRLVLRRYRDAGVISVYQYLEQRIHVSARLVASFSFILFSIGRMGLVLYLPALAFSMVTGSDLLTTIIVMGMVVTIYTVMGGMEAVIWTDFVQAIIMVAGALVSLVFILVKAGGAHFLDIATAHHKFRLVQMHGDWTSILTAFLILETIYQTIRIYGTQQDITQRYMTTRSTKKANASVWIAILGYIPFALLFFFIGTALFVYYQLTPDPAVPAMVAKGKADAIYPFFVASRLPAAVSGLVIAAIFAAAMSSIDACMNASSTVCVEDFYRRFRTRPLSERHYLLTARGLTVVWGILGTVMAVLMMNVRVVQIVWGKVMGITTNGVLGLMALAFLPRPVRWWAALAGFAAGCVSLVAVMYFIQVEPDFAVTFPAVAPGKGRLNYLLWPVVGNTTCFLVGWALDRLVPRPEGGEAATAA